ncbi:MAG TPA: TldD/PmbA family protein [Candidatus Binatia bacterium]|nr:TldD/PmbA family protein [Candidatus Binatia bacterium]
MRTDSWSRGWPGSGGGVHALPPGSRSRFSHASRRDFLRSCGTSALAIAAADLIPGAFVTRRAAAAVLPPDQLEALGAVALDRARSLGASYADIRINRYRTQSVILRSAPDWATGAINNVPSVSDEESFGFGVRVIHGGAWGFAASADVDKDTIARMTAEAVGIARAHAKLRGEPVRLAKVPPAKDVYRTPIEKDPFATGIAAKIALLQQVSDEVRKVPGIFSVTGFMELRQEDRFFASTENSVIRQVIVQVAPEYTAVARDLKARKTKSRTFRPDAVCGGYEFVERAGMVDSARRIGEEAVNHLKSPSVVAGKKDLVLLPTHLALTIHESIGHSTELDRAMGYEANYAGTSFLTTDKLGKFRVGSDLVNIVGDRILPQALSTCGYDDDGAKTRRFPILKNGIFVGYQTTREQAHWIGQEESMACCYADSYASVPFQRMPNVWLQASETPRSLDDLVAGVDDGVLIDGRGSYSIDHQRYNFQFGGDAFWEIKGGKVGPMIADVAYQSRTPDFWQSCDQIGDQSTWRNVGLNRDGKGEPGQINAMSHGCPPSRFRGITVIRTE